MFGGLPSTTAFDLRPLFESKSVVRILHVDNKLMPNRNLA